MPKSTRSASIACPLVSSTRSTRSAPISPVTEALVGPARPLSVKLRIELSQPRSKCLAKRSIGAFDQRDGHPSERADAATSHPIQPPPTTTRRVPVVRRARRESESLVVRR